MLGCFAETDRNQPELCIMSCWPPLWTVSICLATSVWVLAAAAASFLMPVHRLTFEDAGVRSKNGLHGPGFLDGAGAPKWKLRCSLAVRMTAVRPYSSSVATAFKTAADWSAARAFNERGEEPRAPRQEPQSVLMCQGREASSLLTDTCICRWGSTYITAAPLSAYIWGKSRGSRKTSSTHWPLTHPAWAGTFGLDQT